MDWAGHMNGWWWWMATLMLVFWGLVIWGFVTLVRAPGRSPDRRAEDILAERYARGEIDEAEYQHGRDLIHS